MRPRTTVILALAALTLLPACGKSTKSDGPVSREQSVQEATRLFNMGRVAEKNRKWADAEVYYRQSISAYDDLAAAWNNLGVVMVQQQNYLEATNAFRRVADLLPQDPTPYENLGITYQRAGYADDALRAYESSLERDPNWLPSIRGYASSVKLLNRANDGDLEVLRRGLMLETDQKWRDLYDFQRLRIEQDLADNEND